MYATARRWKKAIALLTSRRLSYLIHDRLGTNAPAAKQALRDGSVLGEMVGQHRVISLALDIESTRKGADVGRAHSVLNWRKERRDA